MSFLDHHLRTRVQLLLASMSVFYFTPFSHAARVFSLSQASISRGSYWEYSVYSIDGRPGKYRSLRAWGTFSAQNSTPPLSIFSLFEMRFPAISIPITV
jgi:hypothetical protein